MARPRLTWRIVVALCCGAFLALAPAVAEARAGVSFGGRPSSIGSRGGRSWEYNGGQPLSRGSPAQPGVAGRPGLAPGSGYPGYGGSALQRHPFMSGLAGGLIGSWLFGRAAGGGAGSAVGALLWILIIGGLVWFALRLFRRTPGTAGWPRPSPFGARLPAAAGAAGPPPARDRGRDVNLADADLQSFQRLHAAIQEAWSAGDLSRLRPLMTPEMLSWFSEELSRNTGRGVRNVVENVRLVAAELTESWEERDRQFATAFLRWQAIDYTMRLGASAGGPDMIVGAPEAIVGGDPRIPVEAEEIWTFMRPRGGDWLLSAIQQV